MARIRTIKPEFWEDEVIGALCREARLLFIGSWTLADDEGLLRWSAAYIKSSLFMFDDDLTVPVVEKLMERLTEDGLLFPYRAGKAQQWCAYVVNFQRHQRINRPTPSKITPPSLQITEVRAMYARRDGWKCHLCGGDIEQKPPFTDGERFQLSVDHILPVSLGGTDHPSNIAAAHITCNKGRGNRTVEEYKAALRAGRTASQFSAPERFREQLTEPVTVSLNAGLNVGREGKGRERKGESGARKRRAPPPPAGKQDYPEIPDVVRRWAVERGFGPYLELHHAHFRDYLANRAGKPYADLDAAFRTCIRADWGAVRAAAQRDGRVNGKPPPPTFDPDRWWTADAGIAAQAAKLGIERRVGENVVQFQARVLLAAGEGPWRETNNVTLRRVMTEIAEKAA